MNRPESSRYTPQNRLLTAILLSGLLLSGQAMAQNYPPPQSTDSQQFNGPPDNGDDQYQIQVYENYAQKAMEFFRGGNYTKAIDLLEKAHTINPADTAILNNLAVSHIQRGVYEQNKEKQNEKAASDYRMALFYLNHDWPDGVVPNDGANQNKKIAENNLEVAYQNLRKNPTDAKGHLNEAWALRRAGKLKEAAVEYAWVTKLNGKHSESWEALGDIYRVNQHWRPAVDAYQKAIANAPAPSDKLFEKLGTALLKTDEAPKAVEAYERGLAINPKNQDALLALEQIWKHEIQVNPRNMSAHVNLGTVYQRMERFDDAMAQYNVAERLAPNNPLIKLNLGSLAQAKGDLPQALQLYQQVLQQDPGNVKALLSVAEISGKQGKPQQAEQVLAQALQNAQDKKAVLEELVNINKASGDPQKIKKSWETYAHYYPQDASVQYRAGLAMHEANDYTAAINYYQQALQLDPNLNEAYANLGSALYAAKRNNEAKVALNKALQIDPNLESAKAILQSINQQNGAESYVEAAKLHEEGHYAEAVAKYEEALKTSPNNAELNARYGLSLEALNRFDQAEKAYDKAISLSPNTADYYYYKGTLLHKQNNLPEAQKLYEKALALNPDLPQVKETLEAIKSASVDDAINGVVDAYNNKQYPKAMQMADQLLKTDPKNATAYYYKGLVFDAQKKTAMARDAYQKSVDLDATNSDAMYALAVAEDTLGQKPQAKQTYQRFLDLVQNQPEDEFVKYAKERLSAL